MNGPISCKHCGSLNFIKKGGNEKSRIFLCKSCGKRFTYSKIELIGTKYDMNMVPIRRQGIKVKNKIDEKTTLDVSRLKPIRNVPNLNDLFTEIKKDNKVIINDVDITNAKMDSLGRYCIRYGVGKDIAHIRFNDLKSMVNANPAARLFVAADNIITLNLRPSVKG